MIFLFIIILIVFVLFRLSLQPPIKKTDTVAGYDEPNPSKKIVGSSFFRDYTMYNI